MFGERLKLARKRAGLSLRDLSDRLDARVSAQAIGKYENGKMFPSSAVLVDIARELDVTLDFLTSVQVAELCGVEFRKAGDTSRSDAARVEAAVIDQVERYLAIEAVLDLPSHQHDLEAQESVVARSFDEAERVANELRASWSLGTDPIPSVTALLEERGIKVLALDMPARFSGLTCEVKRASGEPSVPVIVVSTGFSVERRRFTLCHELAHRLIGEVSGDVDHEKVMHRFASAFLMPADRMRAEFGNARSALAYDEIRRVKQTYGVSAAALVIRLRDLGIIGGGYVTYLFQTQARTWKIAEPDPLVADGETARGEEPQRFERLVLRALAERLISLPRAATLLQRPPHDVELAIKGPAISDARHRQ